MSDCAYCGREAHYGDRDCHGCGAPVRTAHAASVPFSQECWASMGMAVPRSYAQIYRKPIFIGDDEDE